MISILLMARCELKNSTRRDAGAPDASFCLANRIREHNFKRFSATDAGRGSLSLISSIARRAA
jgi:hypothetical protein